MAVHEDRRASEKRLDEDGDDMPIFNAENLQSNMKSIYYSRTFLSITGGVVAGIWGFTGLMGFIFYFLIMATASLGFAAKANFSIHNYFDCWNRIVVDGFLGGLMSFVLFWTFPASLLKIGCEKELLAALTLGRRRHLVLLLCLLSIGPSIRLCSLSNSARVPRKTQKKVRRPMRSTSVAPFLAVNSSSNSKATNSRVSSV